MTELLSPSPYAAFEPLPPHERAAAIRLRDHRRALSPHPSPQAAGGRGMSDQARFMSKDELIEMGTEIASDTWKLAVESEQDRILSIITEHAQRYSTGSQGRIALETLALEIRKRG